MGKWEGQWMADENEGVWIKTDYFGDKGIRLVIQGEVVAMLTGEQLRHLWEARTEALEQERKRILKLLEKNLDRFDYSNNRCEQLSFDEFAKMTER